MKVKLNPSGWLWVLYPVAVVIFMVTGLNFLLAAGPASVTQFTVKKSEIEEEKLQAENLKAKLESLKAVDTQEVRKQLEVMLSAVPPARAVWLLISELNLVESRSGMALSSYKGAVGDVQEATDSGSPASESASLDQSEGMILRVEYSTPGLAELAAGLEAMEKFLPLVKIVKIDYSIDSVEMTVEGAWSAWPAANTNPQQALPQNLGLVQKQLAAIAELENTVASQGATF